MRLLSLLLMAAFPALAGFTACQPLVIHHGQVPNTDQAGFVLTINDTDPRLATVANGGYVQSSNGYDIVFSSDSAGSSLLQWDPLETYNPATGRIVTHVQVGLVSHSTDTTIYRCAGNSRTTAFQGGTAGAAWPASYTAVYHFGNGTTLDTSDATTNGRTAVRTGMSAAAGIIGGAANFAASADRLSVAPDQSWPGGGIFTFSAWIKPASLASTTALMRFSGSYNDMVLYISGGRLSVYYSQPVITGGTALTAGTWYHVALVSNGTGHSASIYVNGALDGSGTLPAQAAGGNLGGYIGTDPYLRFTGLIDEVRIVNNSLSPDRIAAEYNNQFSPGTFYSVGPWTASSTGPSSASQTFIF